MTPTFRLAALAALALCAARPARADWTGTLKIHAEPSEARGDMEGTISAKAGKQRIETEQGPMGKVVMINDIREQKVTTMMPARHAFMTLDASKPLPGHSSSTIHIKCESLEPTECLTKQGFTKSGVETVNGKKSDKWEGDHDDPRGGKMHETIWIPQGVKGFAMVKEVTKTATRTMTLDVLDFKETSLPAAQFEVPADYTDLSGKFGPGMMGPPGAQGGAPAGAQ